MPRSPPVTETCLPRETLKRYLSGAIDAEQTDWIETHLAACAECEQTLVQLEADPDTLLASLRDLGNVKSQANSALADSPGVVKRAVAAARRTPDATRGPSGPLRKLDQIGAYELLEQIGQGSMGQVFLARHASLDKRVAIKLLFAHSPQAGRFDFVSRFQREMKAAGRLHHPSIVSATDAGEAGGTHYLVMEHIDGLDLSRIARAVGPLSIANACELMRQAALGLSHAHAEGIVHRDIKPSNLMLDGQGRLKIMDFGLAQWNLWDGAAGELTTVGQLMGTLDYMAPEQAERTDGVDYRADLYALGATLFRLLTGRAPLAAAPNMTLLEKVRLLGSQSAPALSSLRSDAPPALVNLVASLLSRQPANRPASAAHVAEALEPLCKGHQLVALLQGARERDLAEVNTHASVEPIRQPAVQSTSAKSQPSERMPLPPRKNRRWLWTAAASVPLLILAGVWLTLELQKGQLVIQSDANVQVKLVRDGKTVEQLTIQPGAQVTRLRADQYEIVVNAPSDQISIDKESFTLRQGETVVAIVKQLPPIKSTGQSRRSPILFDQMLADRTKNETPQPSAAQPSPPRTQPLGPMPPSLPGPSNPQDLSLERMLQNLEEASTPQLKRLALMALSEKLGPTDGGQANGRLLADARKWNYDSSGMASNGRDRSYNWQHIDDGLMACLSQCNTSAQFVELLHTELLTGDRVWVTRWLSSLVRLDYRNQPRFLPHECVGAALLYVLSDRFAQGPFQAFDSAAGQQWSEFVKKQLVGNRLHAQLYSTTFVDRMAKHSAMGRMAVLQLEPYRLDNRLEILNPMAGQSVLEEALANDAKKVLVEAQGTPEELAHAAYRLATTGPFVERWREELQSALRSQLKLLNASDVDRTFSPLPMRAYAPKDWQPVPTQFGEQWPATCDVSAEQLADAPQFRGVRYTNSEVLAYLALVKRLKLTIELDAELSELMSRCIEQEKPLHTLVFSRHEFPPKVGGGFAQETLDSLDEPWRGVPASVWTASLVNRAISNLANEDIHDDSQLSEALLRHNTTVDLRWSDRDGDSRLSIEELKGFTTYSPVEDKNGDGSYDYDELLASRRKSMRQMEKDFLEAARGNSSEELKPSTEKALPLLPAAPGVSDLSTNTPVTEKPAIYEGRTLDEWLEIAQRDQSLDSRLKALHAVGALAPTARASEITERLIQLATDDTHPTTTRSVSNLLECLNSPDFAIGDIAQSSDGKIFGALMQIYSDKAFQELLATKLLAGDDQWTARWWLQLVGSYRVSPRQRTKSYKLPSAMAMSWLEPAKFESLGEQSLPIAVNYFYLMMQQDAELAREYFPVLLKRMIDDPRLGKSFVLQERSRLSWRLGSERDGRESQLDSRNYVWTVPPGEPIMEDAMTALAKEWFLADESNPEICARAGGWLATTSGATESWREDLVPVLRRRLKALCENSERLSAALSMNGVPKSSGWKVVKARSSPSRDRGPLSESIFGATSNSPISFASNSRQRYISNEVLCYVALVKRLKATSELADELLACARLTSHNWLMLELRLLAAENDISRTLPPWPFAESWLGSWPDTTSQMWVEHSVFEQLGELLATLPADSEGQKFVAEQKKKAREP